MRLLNYEADLSLCITGRTCVVRGYLTMIAGMTFKELIESLLIKERTVL